MIKVEGEIYDGISESEKITNEVATSLTEYLIEREQTRENGEYIGSFDRIDKLEYISKVKSKLLEGEEKREEIIEDLHKDALSELNKKDGDMRKVIKICMLAIAVKENVPMREIYLDEQEIKRQEYKVSFASYLGEKNFLCDIDMDIFNKYIDKLVDNFLETNEPNYFNFLDDEIENKEIYKEIIKNEDVEEDESEEL